MARTQVNPNQPGVNRRACVPGNARKTDQFPTSSNLTNSTNLWGYPDISQLQREEKQRTHNSRIAGVALQIEIWHPLRCVWCEFSINSTWVGQIAVVGSSIPCRYSHSPFQNSFPRQMAEVGSWNTGTEVSFGGNGSLDPQSAPHLKIAPNLLSFL